MEHWQAEHLAAGAKALLLRNRRSGYDTNVGHLYAYTCPSPGEYPWQWSWDSCFHAIALTHFDQEQAEAELRTLLAAQHEDGFIPHVIHWGASRAQGLKVSIASFGQSRFGAAQTSALLQPPVLAQAVRRVAELSRGGGFLQECLPKVMRHYRWIAENRDPDSDGLVSVISPYETGMDQLPTFDQVLGAGKNPSALVLHARDRWVDIQNLVFSGNFDMARIDKRDLFTVEDVAFNCIFAQGLQDVARLCDTAHDTANAEAFRGLAMRTEAAILTKFYDPADGLFWSLGTRHERPLKVLTIASLFPLLLESIDRPRVEELAALVKRADAFWLRYPLPSVAKSEPSFRPESSVAIWRGPTWVNINWFIAKGLERHGFPDLAEALSERTAEMVFAAGFREFYSPITGAGLGAKDFGWSTLVVDML